MGRAHQGGRRERRLTANAMPDVSLTRKSARELVRLLRTGAVSPVEVVEAHLEVISRLNPGLNAIVTLAGEQALDAARLYETRAKSHEPPGLLHGLPVAIKDTTATAGVRTTFGSRLFKDHVPIEDAEVVRRLKAAGGIIIAKTNTPEFGCGAFTNNELFGATRNPWNPELSPAGSSGGSAVAVAAGMVPLAQGTDFACSVRVPAAFCGIVGIRPTPGLIPNYPTPLSWDPAQVQGVLARDAQDVALMLDSIVGISGLSPISLAAPWRSAREEVGRRPDLGGLRVAYCPDIARAGTDGEIDSLCREMAHRLIESGAVVEEVTFDLSDGRGAYLTWRGSWMVNQHYCRLHDLAHLGEDLRSEIEFGLKLTPIDIAAAERKRSEIFHRFRLLFDRFDVLLTPASIAQPFSAGTNYPSQINGRQNDHSMMWVAPSFLVTFAALPAVSAPAALTRGGLPVGLQIVGPRFAEPLLLNVADLIHQVSGIRWPPSPSHATLRRATFEKEAPSPPVATVR
jgi:amidase